MNVTPYIFLPGTAEEALGFYERAGLGTPDEVLRFTAEHLAHVGPGMENKIMHARITGEDGDRIMLSDTAEDKPIQGVACAISLSDLAEATRLFAALAEGGQVTMPFARQFWGDDYGQLVDRFGVHWMVNCDATPKS